KLFAPSILADSSIAYGITEKDCLIKKTPKAVVTWGNTIPAYVLSNPNFKAIIKIGTINIWNGFIMFPRFNIKLTFLLLKLFLPIDYVPVEQIITLKTTFNIFTTKLLK